MVRMYRTRNSIPFKVSVITVSSFLLILSASTPANGFTRTVDNAPITKVIAKFRPEPVIFNTYKLIAKLYIDVPNTDIKLAIENKPIFNNSLFLEKFFSDRTFINIVNLAFS